jgi:hypothetical protein
VRSIVVFRRSCFVQHTTQLLFFFAGQGRSMGSLRLQQSTQENSVVHLGADLAEISVIGSTCDYLSLKDLGFTLVATLANCHQREQPRSGTAWRTENEEAVPQQQDTVNQHTRPAKTVYQAPELSGK